VSRTTCVVVVVDVLVDAVAPSSDDDEQDAQKTVATRRTVASLIGTRPY
jgi:hypothetical protein